MFRILHYFLALFAGMHVKVLPSYTIHLQKFYKKMVQNLNIFENSL